VRLLSLIICFAVLSSTASAWSGWNHKYNEEKPISSERDYILRIFDFYSQIQKNFEKEGFSGRSRDLLEDYTSAILLPACSSCAKLLSRGHDTELMFAYFRLLQFTQHSASESFGSYLAEICRESDSRRKGLSTTHRQTKVHWLRCVVLGIRQYEVWQACDGRNETL